MSIHSARSPFCDANGAEVSDMMDFSLYLRQLEESDADDGTDENEDNKKKEVETEEAKKKGGRDEEAAALNSPNTVRPPLLYLVVPVQKAES